LLSLLHAPWLDEIDFGRMRQIKTTFIRRDYRHLESDIVLTAPLAGPQTRKRPLKNLLIYVLIEHQSEPDRLMPLRLADSQLQIFRYQVRQWSRTHRSLARVRLMPVLPVVFYTGLRRWPQLGTLADLVERGDEFRLVTPIVERPLFLNLPELDAAALERDGGYFGWVLRLVQQRKSRAGEFQELLERVNAHLEAMPPAERQRWRDLLSYVGAMVYHDRSRERTCRVAGSTGAVDAQRELRQEVIEMGKSMADVLMERGWTAGEQKGTEGRKRRSRPASRRWSVSSASVSATSRAAWCGRSSPRPTWPSWTTGSTAWSSPTRWTNCRFPPRGEASSTGARGRLGR
jgi:hypothetical protein